MTTDVEALIAELKKNGQMVAPSVLVVRRSADALRSQAILITRLKSMTDAQEQLIREHIQAQRKAEERAEGLAAKCALLAASLAQEEAKCAELERNAPSWINVEDQLPDSGKTVFATYLNRLGKLRRIRAQYIAPKTREQNPDNDELEGEYDEATDTYYWTAGWYERIDNWSDYSHVAVCEGNVTHWMPMPDAPIATQTGSKEGA